MKIKKLTKKSLAELNLTLSGLDDASQRECIGGGSGTQFDPWSYEEYQTQYGCFLGGWVDFGGEDGVRYLSPSAGLTAPWIETASFASSYVGLTEINSPSFVEDVLESVGLERNVTIPWCAAFVSFVFTQMGIPNPNSASVDAWRNWGHISENPIVGDVVFFEEEHHIGIVTSVDGDYVTITSGNSRGSDGLVNAVTSKRYRKDNINLTYRTL